MMESDAFRAMFYGDLKETGDIKIVDVSVDAFKEFLQFFYLDQIKLSMKNITEVIYLVQKYMVDDCIGICEQFLNESLTNDNVCSIYEIAIRFDLDFLMQQCQNRIKKNAVVVFQTQGFHECNKTVLSQILKSNAMSCTEREIFLACMDWMKAVCGQIVVTKDMVRHHLGELFYEIRFGSMKIQEFSQLLPTYGSLFTADEYQEIIQMTTSSEFKPTLFKKGSRQICNRNGQKQFTAFQFNSSDPEAVQNREEKKENS